VIAGAALGVLAASSAGAQSSRDDSSMLSNGLRAPNALADAHTTHQQPEGYLGITFVCDLRRQYGPEGLTIYHYGYPAVEFVQPGSPADRAGIVAGDTIVAYDSRDVLYRKIVLARLLRPGSELAVRIRRNGSVKNLNVSIAPRPALRPAMGEATSAAAKSLITNSSPAERIYASTTALLGSSMNVGRRTLASR